jgi:hypothetical protein
MSLELGHMNPGIDFERLKRNRERERLKLQQET